MLEKPELYIGLMSGTSLDSIDCVIVDLSTTANHLVASLSHNIPDQLKTQIRLLMLPGKDNLDLMGSVDQALGICFAEAVNALLTQAQLQPNEIRAIGSHGQTVRHRPNAQLPFTLQIGDPNQIAERTGITTIADFRRRDMSVGGQGAPLVPAFHRALFGQKQATAVLNIGGMANLTLLDNQALRGFDTGPGNILLDSWYQQHHNDDFDQNGDWSAAGQVFDQLLNKFLQHSFFSQQGPKSTGREDFNLNWLQQQLDNKQNYRPEDVQATLVALTAKTVATALVKAMPDCKEMLVCGGGVHNQALLSQLQAQLPNTKVASTQDYDVNPDWVEAWAFAWMAQRFLHGQSSNAPAVTGARKEVILGAKYPGYWFS